MNVIIPPKRRDKRTSFKTLVAYVSTREEKKNSDAVTASPVSTVVDHKIRTPE
jgi:hypothetical protein